MAHERRAVDICTTPPLTPTAVNGKSLKHDENRGNAADWRGDVEYTLKPATRAYASTARLNLQHYLWKDQTGFLLHPTIPLDGRTDLKIADVGTGTGIWLLDLARTLPPTAQLDGFDIDISDCPAAQWLPPNVTMRHLDGLGEIPEELIGVYDVVQLRLFQVVVKDNDPGPLLRNVVSMLKPGGHLQWAEYDMTTLTTILASPTLPHTTLSAIPAFVSAFKPHDARVGTQDWIPTLPRLFRTAGALTHVTASRYATSDAWLPYQLDVFLLTYEELAGKMLDGLGGGVGDRLRGLVEGAREEGRRGVGWGMERLVVVGRKGEAEGSAGVGEGVGGEKEGAGEGGGVGVGGNGERSVDLPVEGVEQTGRKEERRRSGREKWLRIWKRLNLSR